MGRVDEYNVRAIGKLFDDFRVQVVTLHDVAAGDYSVTALHDVDGDRQMKIANGRPAEGWGMLHGETLRAAPTFDQVKFTVPATGDVALTVAMMDYPAAN